MKEKTRNHRIGIGLIVSAAMGVACGARNDAPGWSIGSGTAALNLEAHERAPWYPNGPYGREVGSVIESLQFLGRHSPASSDPSDPAASISLSQYMHHGQTKTNVLVISAEAGSCVPCSLEQATLSRLSADYESFAPGRVAFVGAITSGRAAGEAPTMQDLDSWAHRFHVSYDLVLWSEEGLFSYATAGVYPTHLVVRTKNMTIASIIEGNAIQEASTGAGPLKDAIDIELEEAKPQ